MLSATLALLVAAQGACTFGGAPPIVAPTKRAPEAVASSDAAPPMQNAVAQLALSDERTCARMVDGRVKCWGLLDADDDRTTATPSLVGSIDDAIDLAVGPSHACVLRRSGRLACWGSNEDGELGDGTHNPALFPTAEPSIDDVTGVALGSRFTCARQTSGSVRCWGRNQHAQLADGSTTSRAVPTLAPALTGVGGLALGRDAGTAFDAGGLVFWGGPSSFAPTHVVVPPLTIFSPQPKVTNVVSSVTHACALLADQTVRCWGKNDEGELGDGTEIERDVPMPVVGLTRVVQLAVGRGTSCARIADGTAKCWGNDNYGQLGDGTFKEATTPTQVAGLARCKQIAIAYGHACALLEDGTVQCWGSNASGELGDGTRKNREVRGPVVW